MGWKNVKEHYRIEHIVRVEDGLICIGSPYIYNLIAIDRDGKIVKRPNDTLNKDLTRYLAEMDADPDKLRKLVQSPDTFAKSITVYTYDHGDILEKQCEQLGWPNITHDGNMMYENTFSADKVLVAKWAKNTARSEIKWTDSRIADILKDLAEIEAIRDRASQDLVKLETDYPEAK